MEPTDSELLTRYRCGQVDALEQLVERFRRPLYGYILNMTEGRDDADEIFQEVWFRVIRKLDGYRQKNFFGWVVRITHNLIIDRHRRRRPEVSLDRETETAEPMVDRISATGMDPQQQTEAADLGRRIADAVSGLPDEQKEVFLLRVQTALPFKEIAGIQKASINTVLARMQYALEKLRGALKDDYAELREAG